MPKINKPYTCPRCGYITEYTTSMHNHLFKKAKPCAALVNNIDLTDEIKAYIMQNRIYITPKVDTSTLAKDLAKLQRRNDEETYQSFLEVHLQGKHKKLKTGVTDITTDTFHAELKDWTSWKESIGQLISYNYDDPKEEMRVYFFGKTPTKTTQEAILNVLLHVNIKPYEIWVADEKNVVIKDLHTSETQYVPYV